MSATKSQKLSYTFSRFNGYLGNILISIIEENLKARGLLDKEHLARHVNKEEVRSIFSSFGGRKFLSKLKIVTFSNLVFEKEIEIIENKENLFDFDTGYCKITVRVSRPYFDNFRGIVCDSLCEVYVSDVDVAKVSWINSRLTYNSLLIERENNGLSLKEQNKPGLVILGLDKKSKKLEEKYSDVKEVLLANGVYDKDAFSLNAEKEIMSLYETKYVFVDTVEDYTLKKMSVIPVFLLFYLTIFTMLFSFWREEGSN